MTLFGAVDWKRDYESSSDCVPVLVIVQVVIAAFTAAVGSFADGGTIWERLTLVVVHPLCAGRDARAGGAATSSQRGVYVVSTLMAVNVLSDLSLVSAIALGALKGDWWLPLIFSVIPAIGLVYTLTLPKRQAPSSNMS